MASPQDLSETIKAETQKQWGNDPAGSIAAGDAELGSELSFKRVEEYRYHEQPWMHDTFRYADHAGRQVLEVGVGLGTDHLQFARAGAKMTGVDLTQECVDLTRRRFEQEGLTTDVRRMDAEHLEFDDDSFDTVYSFGVLHHTPDMVGAFREVRRVLKPGGSFIGGLYAKYSWFHALMLAERLIHREYRWETLAERYARVEVSNTDATPLVRLLSGRELKGMLRTAGFDTVSLRKRHMGLALIDHRVPPIVAELAGRIGGWYLVHDAR